MLPSISYPELMVSPDGKIFKDGKQLSLRASHYAGKGPYVYFYEGNKQIVLSVQTLVYEVYVVGRHRSHGERIRILDGDDFNTKASNMIKMESKERYVNDQDIERVYGYNGSDEIYC